MRVDSRETGRFPLVYDSLSVRQIQVVCRWLISCYERDEQLDETLARIEVIGAQIRQRYADVPDVLVAGARMHLAVNDIAQAGEFCSMALAMDPTSASALEISARLKDLGLESAPVTPPVRAEMKSGVRPTAAGLWVDAGTPANQATGQFVWPTPLPVPRTTTVAPEEGTRQLLSVVDDVSHVRPDRHDGDPGLWARRRAVMPIPAAALTCADSPRRPHRWWWLGAALVMGIAVGVLFSALFAAVALG